MAIYHASYNNLRMSPFLIRGIAYKLSTSNRHTPVDVMTFENVYTEKTAPGEDAKPTEGSDPNASNKSAADNKTAAATPHTGDANMLIVAIAALLIAASALLASTLATKKR